MKIIEAYQTLGLREGDGYEEAKKAYRNLMRQFHPDSAGEGEDAHRQAQKINEAYRLIKKELQSGGVVKTFKAAAYRSWKEIDPGIPVNPMAYCERCIFLEDEMLGEHLADTGLAGRYYWDPEVESFELLLRSVNMAVSQLLYHMDLDETEAFRRRSALLHLLLQEFIDPMDLIENYAPIRKEGDIYTVHCGIRSENPLPRTGSRFEVRADGSKLYAIEDEMIAGQLTFIENALYYIMTPLILQGCVAAEAVVTDVSRRKITAVLNVRMTGKAYKDMSDRINKEIRRRV